VVVAIAKCSTTYIDDEASGTPPSDAPPNYTAQAVLHNSSGIEPAQACGCPMEAAVPTHCTSTPTTPQLPAYKDQVRQQQNVVQIIHEQPSSAGQRAPPRHKKARPEQASNGVIALDDNGGPDFKAQAQSRTIVSAADQHAEPIIPQSSISPGAIRMGITTVDVSTRQQSSISTVCIDFPHLRMLVCVIFTMFTDWSEFFQ
jgi:hypothetical protein